MAITEKKRGYALIVAVILTSVMLSFGTALSSLAYKQKVLASDATESQYAFYAADAALECALYADQQKNLFDYASHDASNPPALITTVACTTMSAEQGSYEWDATALSVSQRISISSTQCADVVVGKYNTGKTDLYIQGYNASCAEVAAGSARLVSRGLEALSN